jgi:polysaccharide export outer membrane protein
MSSPAREKSRLIHLLPLLSLFIAALVPLRAQEQMSGSNREVQNYLIGPGDVLTVSVAYIPDIGGKIRVSDNGSIAVPGLPGEMKAAGATASVLAQEIAKDLKTALIVRDPIVTIYLDEYRSRTITVLGAVTKPSVYPLEKPTTLLEGLSMAGGLLPTAGGEVTLIRKGRTLPIGHITGETNSATISLGKLMSGQDTSLNIELQAGDVVSVAVAPVVYVLGAVNKPGGFTLEGTNSGMTVLQAIAKAEGTKSTAATQRSIIVRRGPDTSEKRIIAIDLRDLASGKHSDLDIDLRNNDVLYIPESGIKKTMKTLGEIAVQGATGVAVYGLGYRVGGR